jgi:hypothetical protein
MSLCHCLHVLHLTRCSLLRDGKRPAGPFFCTAAVPERVGVLWAGSSGSRCAPRPPCQPGAPHPRRWACSLGSARSFRGAPR